MKSKDRYGFDIIYQHKGRESRSITDTITAPDFKAEINRKAVEEFFTFGHFATQGHWFKGIEIKKPEWKLEYNHIDIELPEAVDEVYRLWMKSMAKAVRGEAGCQLSGGYDSRLIAATLAKMKTKPVETLTFGMAGCDDLRIAKQVCDAVGANHNTYTLTPENWFNHRKRGVWLSGGAVGIHDIRFMDILKMQTQLMDINVSGFLGDVIIGGSFTQGKQPIIEAEAFRTRFRRFTNYGELLQKTEHKVTQPFINNELVDFCFSLPMDMRRLLYDPLFKKYFPEVADIPRQKGLMIDYRLWYSQGGGQIKSILFDKDALYTEYIQRSTIEKAWGKDYNALGRAVTFEIFLQQYFNQRYLPFEQEIDFDVKERREAINDYAKNHWVKNNMHESINDPHRPWHKPRVEAIVNQCYGKTILDIAPADGAITELIRLKHKPDRIVACEGGAATIENGRKLHSKIEWIQGMAEDLPFGTKEFEFAHAGEIIEHIAKPERLIEQISKIVTNGALITTPAIPVNDPQHISIFTPEALKETCLKYFNYVDIIIQPRTLFAVCRKKVESKLKLVKEWTIENESKVLHVTPIPFDRGTGDVSQSLNILKSIASTGLKVDVLHFEGLAGGDLDKMRIPIDGVEYHGGFSLDTIIDGITKYWNNSYKYALVRSPELIEMASKIIPKNKLIGYIYGEYFAYKNINNMWGMCGKVITQGDGCMQYVRDHGLDESKTIAIPCAVDTEKFKKKFVIGHAGALLGYQCMDEVITGLEAARARGMDCRFICIGASKSHLNLRSTQEDDAIINKINTYDWITWIKTLPQSSIPTMLSNIDCVITLFDQNKGKPRPHSGRMISTKALEYMSMGIPIITNHTYGYDYMLGDDYPLFVESPEDIVDAIEKLHDAKFAEKISKFLIDKVNNYNIKKVGEYWREAFQVEHKELTIKKYKVQYESG